MAPWRTILVSVFIGPALADSLCQTEQGSASDTCSDEGAMFLQRSGRAYSQRLGTMTRKDWLHRKAHRKASLLNKNAVTAVEPMPCESFTNPLQVMKTPTGFAVKELEIASGNYMELFVLPFSIVPGGYQDLNACGINPDDDILYCVMFAAGPYIVRVDAQAVEFVARLPWGGYISASFAPSGNFYVGTLNSHYVIVKQVSQMSSSADKAQAADLRQLSRTQPEGFSYSADCVAISKDLEGNGEEEYLFVLYGPKLQIAKYDFAANKWAQTWIINVRPPRWDNVYGAGWAFQNNIFFASNRGSGVYRIPMRNFTLTKSFDPSFQMRLKKIGASDQVGSNDGFNCMGNPSPWVIPFDCKDFPGPIQAFWREPHYDLLHLNTTTGNYTNVWQVNKNQTDPPFRVLNAWGINPKDGVVYASLVIDEFDMSVYPTPPPFYIVRIDDTKVRFVAKVQAPFGSPIAGAFDSAGNYFVVSNPSLLSFSNLADLKEYDDYEAADLPYFGEDAEDKDFNPIAIKNMSGAAQIADIVAIDADLGDGSGETSWVLSANTALQLVLMKPSEGTYHIIPTNDVLDGTELEGVWERQNLGAGWSFQGKVYFASNDGAGVFQVPMDKVKFPLPPSVTLTNVGISDPIHDNDGLNCVNKPSPWK